MRRRMLKVRQLLILAGARCASTESFLQTFCGICLAATSGMGAELLCDHCERTLMSNAYRVISQDAEGGGILLDMIVCHPCSQKAQELGLKIEAIDLKERYLKRG
jgi:hypothetical protein